MAYGRSPNQFTRPDWMKHTGLQIEVTVPAGATPEQLHVMERNLLADRFLLKVHFDKKEVKIYQMFAVRDGVKFRPAAADQKVAQRWATAPQLGFVWLNNALLSMDQLASFLTNVVIGRWSMGRNSTAGTISSCASVCLRRGAFLRPILTGRCLPPR